MVLCALLGATQAVRDYYYDDDRQYDSADMKHFIEFNSKNLADGSNSHNDKEYGKAAAPKVAPAAPVA